MDQNHSDSLNVLLLAEDFYPKESGGAFIDWNVAKFLAESGDVMTVVTPRNDQTAKSETVAGVEILRPFSGPSTGTHPNSGRGIFKRILFTLLVIPYLCSLCWDREFDIVYSTNYLFHPPATILSVVFRIPHVTFIGYSPSIRDDASLSDLLVILERINFRWFMGNKVLCQTPSVQKVLSKYPKVNVSRLDGIVDEDAVESAVDGDLEPEIEFEIDRAIQLIFVGRLVEIKNPAELPVLVKKLPEEYSLLIVGDGPQWDTVNAAIQDADIGDRVHSVGRLPHEVTLQMIHESDILVLPSKTESYGAVVFEALSLNTPVVATPVGILPTIDHPDLHTAQLENFAEKITTVDAKKEHGINKNTLQQFSVTRFSENVRDHLLTAARSKGHLGTSK